MDSIVALAVYFIVGGVVVIFLCLVKNKNAAVFVRNVTPSIYFINGGVAFFVCVTVVFVSIS